MNWPVIFWVSILVLALIIEFQTVDVVSFFIVFGSLSAAIVSVFSHEPFVQTIVFFVVAGGATVAFFPLWHRYQKSLNAKTGLDAVIGSTRTIGKVEDGSPLVNIDGVWWEAKTDNVLVKGDSITVKSIKGSKLYVDLNVEDSNIKKGDK